MTARMKLGMFDPDEDIPWSDLDAEIVACSKHSRVALETARKSMVLLKNEKNALPLSKDLKKIAVIGPNSSDIEVMCGNYNGTPLEPITPLQGIKDVAEENGGFVKYARGCAHAEGLPFLEVIPSEFLFSSEKLDEKGLIATYYPNLTGEGEAVFTGVDQQVDFNWWDMAPKEGLEDDMFSVKWTGFLVPDVSGTYALGCEAKFFKMLVNGQQIVANENIHHPNKRHKNMELKAGQAYKIEIHMWDEHGDALCHLMWAPPEKNLHQEAIKAARWADQVIMFMGLSPRLEGEEMRVEVEGFNGGDRTSMELPAVQGKLIKDIVATGKPVVLVLMNGSALSINWENENVPAILEAWYPGEAAGKAIADILFGDYNPSGSLPITFYKSIEDLPPFENYDMAGRTYRFFEDEVLYPFGFGLSYSEFTFTNLVLSKDEINPDDTLGISVDVTNNSDISGEEVVQFYIHEVNSEGNLPNLDLRGFERVRIKGGETKTVSIELTQKELAYYNFDKESYTLDPGIIEIFAGPSSDRSDLLKTKVKVN
jgi:beta-glucosidase